MIVILWFIIHHIFDIQVSEEVLRLIHLILSLEGVTLVSASVIGLSLLISHIGSHIFSRKRSYV